MFAVQLVDDEPIVRIGLEKLIPWEELGFKVICEAANGEEALQQLESNPIDLIITDIEMPIMNGIEFMSCVRERGFGAEIIVLTAYGEFEYAKEAIKYGVAEYVLKPIEEDEISRTLNIVKKKLLKKVEGQSKDTRHYDVIEKGRELSRDKDKLLIQCVMTAEQKVFEILEDIVREESNYGDQEIMSMCVRFSYILEEIGIKTREKFSYLNKLVVIEEYVDFGNIEGRTKRELLNIFKEKITRLFQIFEESKVIYKDNIVMQACQYVIEHIDENISLTTISEKLAISKNYFCSLFKQETGENFLNFVTRMKMKRARFLLKHENLKVYEVCDRLGYTDTTYFTRLFKKYVHITPNEYKKVVYDQYE